MLQKLAAMSVSFNLRAHVISVEQRKIGHGKPDNQLNLVRSLQLDSEHDNATFHSSGGC